MNKYLMMSAAGLVATVGTAGTANAGTRSFHFGTSTGTSYCDGGKGTWHGAAYVWVHNFTHACGFSFNAPSGPGIAGYTKGIGKNVNMTDTYTYSHALCSYDFPARFLVGGHWSLWCVTGTSVIEVNHGVILAGLARHQPGAAKSSLSAVKDILAKMKAQKS